MLQRSRKTGKHEKNECALSFLAPTPFLSPHLSFPNCYELPLRGRERVDGAPLGPDVGGLRDEEHAPRRRRRPEVEVRVALGRARPEACAYLPRA